VGRKQAGVAFLATAPFSINADTHRPGKRDHEVVRGLACPLDPVRPRHAPDPGMRNPP
jgi:hypothetical protein